MLLMLLGDTVTEVCTSPRNLTWFTRPFLLVRGRGLEMRLQATMHLLRNACLFMQKAQRCMTITFIHRSKIVVQEMYGLVHISDFKSSKCVKV